MRPLVARRLRPAQQATRGGVGEGRHSALLPSVTRGSSSAYSRSTTVLVITNAATSIGFRPTFGGDRLTVEAYLLDFDGDLYGRPVRLEFVSRLRGERKFIDAAALIAQMHRDVEETRRRLRK